MRSKLLPSDEEVLQFADGNTSMAINSYRWRNGQIGDRPAYSWGLFLSGMSELGLLTEKEVRDWYWKLSGTDK